MSEPTLEQKIAALPRRVERLGGQSTSYVQLDNVFALVEAHQRAELAAAKLAAVEAFYAAVMQRENDALAHSWTVEAYATLRVAIDEEIAKWREVK